MDVCRSPSCHQRPQRSRCFASQGYPSERDRKGAPQRAFPSRGQSTGGLRWPLRCPPRRREEHAVASGSRIDSRTGVDRRLRLCLRVRAQPCPRRRERLRVGHHPAPFGKPAHAISLHTQLVSHVTTGQTAVPPELSLTAVNITATVVGTLALLSLAFVVVTLIRRRITS
jgi:hypothetical protein